MRVALFVLYLTTMLLQATSLGLLVFWATIYWAYWFYWLVLFVFGALGLGFWSLVSFVVHRVSARFHKQRAGPVSAELRRFGRAARTVFCFWCPIAVFGDADETLILVVLCMTLVPALWVTVVESARPEDRSLRIVWALVLCVAIGGSYLWDGFGNLFESSEEFAFQHARLQFVALGVALFSTAFTMDVESEGPGDLEPSKTRL